MSNWRKQRGGKGKWRTRNSRGQHKLESSSIFWVTVRRKMVWNRRFGTTYRSYLQGSICPLSSSTTWPMKMGSTDSPETPISNHLTPRNHPEYGRIQFNCGGSLSSHKIVIIETGKMIVLNLLTAQAGRQELEIFVFSETAKPTIPLTQTCTQRSSGEHELSDSAPSSAEIKNQPSHYTDWAALAPCPSQHLQCGNSSSNFHVCDTQHYKWHYFSRSKCFIAVLLSLLARGLVLPTFRNIILP